MDTTPQAQPPPETDVFAAVDFGPPPPGYRIEVVEGPDRGTARTLRTVPLTIGSASHADLVLNDSAVSRVHARLAPVVGGVEVRDMGSKNGTFVSSHRVLHAFIASGAQVRIGRSTLRVVPEQPAPLGRRGLCGLDGQSEPMRRLYQELERLAPLSVPVLLEGEPGVGKVRAARALHLVGPRRLEACVVLAARELGPGGVRAELKALEGTVVVSELEQLSEPARRALLVELALFAGKIRFVGTTRRDLNRSLASSPEERALLERLGLVRLRVPPLRERSGDLLLLIDEICAELGHPAFPLRPEDMGRLQAHRFPENVKELRRALARIVSGRSDAPALPGNITRSSQAVVGADMPYKAARAQMVEAFEREYARSLLERCAGNVSQAARTAGIDRVYLHRLIKKYGL